MSNSFLWNCPSKIQVHVELHNMPLFGFRFFIDVIKMRLYRIRMGPEFLGNREIWTHTHRGEDHLETEQRLERRSYKARNAEHACNTGSWDRQGSFSPEPLEGARPCWCLDFGLLASRTVREYFSVISHPAYMTCPRSQPDSCGIPFISVRKMRMLE